MESGDDELEHPADVCTGRCLKGNSPMQCAHFQHTFAYCGYDRTYKNACPQLAFSANCGSRMIAIYASDRTPYEDGVSGQQAPEKRRGAEWRQDRGAVSRHCHARICARAASETATWEIRCPISHPDPVGARMVPHVAKRAILQYPNALPRVCGPRASSPVLIARTRQPRRARIQMPLLHYVSLSVRPAALLPESSPLCA